MNYILLSGGSGKRLWPLSNNIRSKQFIKVFDNEKGEKESMLQRMYRGVKSFDHTSKVVVATSKNQISEIINQIGKDVSISAEPCRKNTFPAIVLSALYLVDVLGADENEPVVVCPIDPFIDDSYFEALAKLSAIAEKGESNLVLMGIQPTEPSEKYGYIIPNEEAEVSFVKQFTEKPQEAQAKEYIKQGALWNSGVFAFKLKYVINIAHSLIPFKDYYDFLDQYESLTNISFDYAVAEKESSIQVMRFKGIWQDLGTWDALTSAMNSKTIGAAVLSDSSENTNIVNETDIPIVCIGVKDIVVAASQDGILISDKSKANEVKKYSEKMDAPVMYAEKSWGNYKVIDIGQHSSTVKVILRKGNKMSYHNHQRRDEVWVVVSGEGTSVVDGIVQNVKKGDVIAIAAGCKHTIIAKTDLVLIEVQLGEDIDVKDKQKFELD